jgi:hypothetical protein
MSASHQGQFGPAPAQAEREQEGLEQERDRPCASPALPHFELKLSGSCILRNVGDPLGAEARSFQLCTRHLSESFHSFEVLRSKSGFLPIGTNVMDCDRFPQIGGQGKGRSQDLAAPFPVRPVNDCHSSIRPFHSLTLTKPPNPVNIPERAGDFTEENKVNNGIME